MAVRKVFIDAEGMELTTFITNENLCYIGVGMFNEPFSEISITLDSDDLLELINELVYIREQMTNE